MSVTVLEPHENDKIANPVTVIAGYSFANSFNLTCKVGASAESPQHHPGGDDRHTSKPISVLPGVYDVSAEGDSSAGSGVQHNVTVTGEVSPIDDVDIDEVKSEDAGKKIRVTGKCDPTTKAAYVISRIFEVNLRTGKRTRVAAGADTTEGKKLAWKVVVAFPVNNARWIEYVAQITSYNLEDKPQGQITKHIKR